MLEILPGAIDIMQARIAHGRLASNPREVLLIPLSRHTTVRHAIVDDSSGALACPVSMPDCLSIRRYQAKALANCRV